MDIQGEWTGVITYGSEYRKYRDKELFFEMEIVQNADRISGKAIDTGGVGVSPDAAIINGTFKDKKIDFIKQYASLHYYHNGNTKIDKSRSGFEISYFGEFNEFEQTFVGNWIIK